MKKIYYLVAAAFALGSCTQERMIADMEQEEVPGHSLEAGILSSRLHIGEQEQNTDPNQPDIFRVQWSEGDSFTAFNVDGTKNIQYNIRKETAFPVDEATFIASENIEPAFAIFPANINPVTTDGRKVSVELPNTVVASNSQNAMMFGKVTDNRVDFKQMMAMMKFQFTDFLPEGCTKVKVSSSQVIAGNFHLEDITTQNLNLIADVENTTQTVVTITDVVNGVPFYLPVPAMTSVDFTISAIGPDASETVLLTLAGKSTEPGKVYTVIRNSDSPKPVLAYFVTPEGKGNLDGSSWDNAMNAEGLYNLVKVNENKEIALANAEKLNGKHIYLSGGIYPNKGVTIDYNVCPSVVSYIIEGGYDPASKGTDLTKRSCEGFLTTFSALPVKDVINMIQINKKVDITFDGCHFEGNYKRADEGKVRAFYVNAVGTNLHLTNCRIEDFNIRYYGGEKGRAGAIYINSGNVFIKNSVLSENTAHNRGGAIFLANGNCQLFMDCCSLSGNYVYDEWSTAIHTGGNARMCMNNTTIYGTEGHPKKKNIVVNGDGYYIYCNTTIIGNKDNQNGSVRSASHPALLINSLFLKGESANTIYYDSQWDKGKCQSYGFNIYQAALAGWAEHCSQKTDTDLTDFGFPTLILQDGVYQWDVTKAGTINGYATQNEVVNAVKGYQAGDVNLGQQFMDWCGEAAFGIDGRGVKRNPMKMQAGAYDQVLN